MKNSEARMKGAMWIDDALKDHKPGALHKQLGVPKGKKIPVATLKKAATGNSVKAKRARLALTLRSFH